MKAWSLFTRFSRAYLLRTIITIIAMQLPYFNCPIARFLPTRRSSSLHIWQSYIRKALWIAFSTVCVLKMQIQFMQQTTVSHMPNVTCGRKNITVIRMRLDPNQEWYLMLWSISHACWKSASQLTWRCHNYCNCPFAREDASAHKIKARGVSP